MGRGLGQPVRALRRLITSADGTLQAVRLVSEDLVVLDVTVGDRVVSAVVAALPEGVGVYEQARVSDAYLGSDRPAQVITVSGCSCGERSCRHLDLAYYARRFGIVARPPSRGEETVDLPLVPGRYAERVFAIVRGDVWGWGRLLHDANVTVAIPVRLTRNGQIVALAETIRGFLTLDQNGKVLLWEEQPPQFARSSLAITSLFTPKEVESLPRITQIAAGAHHSLALDRDGRVWAWGDNRYGQCGIGTLDEKELPRPRMVPDLHGVVAIAAGARSSYALREDGRVFAWGDNVFSQCGIPRPSRSMRITVPTAVRSWGFDPPEYETELHNVVALAAGLHYVLALRNDGTLVGWGSNDSRQLLGSSSHYRNLAEPLQLRNVRAIAAGPAHALAVRTDGKVLAWGSNRFGQLGTQPSNRTFRTPRVVPGIENAIAVAAGSGTSFAILKDGWIVAWGDNRYGIQGNGRTSLALFPDVVLGVRQPVQPATIDRG